MVALAGTYHMLCDQGATFTRAFVRKDSKRRVAPFEELSVRMQVRSDHSSPTTLIEATTGNGMVVVDGARGRIDVTVPADVTAAVPAGLYVYDLEIVFADETVERMVMGNFTVRPEATR
jgi:hypothetical protein